MAWTIPATPTAGQVLAATYWNEQIRDNMNALKAPPFQQIVWSGTASTTATTAVPVDTANLSINLTTYGGNIHVYFQAWQNHQAGLYGLFSDGTGFNGNSALSRGVTAFSPVSFDVWVTGLASGSHTFRPSFLSQAGTTLTVNGLTASIIFWAREG